MPARVKIKVRISDKAKPFEIFFILLIISQLSYLARVSVFPVPTLSSGKAKLKSRGDFFLQNSLKNKSSFLTF